METIKELNDKFGLNGTLQFQMKDELIFLEGENKFAKFALSLHGAHITSYKPTGDEDILWVSRKTHFKKNKAIRGGIPICWPWFCEHPEDKTKPSHGFARIADWTLIETALMDDMDTITVTLELTSNCETRKLWPYEFTLQNKITFGDTLKVELITENRDTTPFTITEALHSYFNICDIRNISINGLENIQYIDSIDHNTKKTQENSITFNGEVDRVYIDTADTCMLSDAKFKRTIKVSKEGSHSTVVWNPWVEKSKRMSDFADDEYQTMVCVETTNALDDAILIEPGKKHSLITQIS